jgi:peptidoglycan hydrolase-like protein with peptidoglycan-binding domain
MKRFGMSIPVCAFVLAMAMPSFAITHPHRGPTSPKLFGKKSKSSSKPSGQRTIDDSRATQIQASLIKSGYLSGEASGHWDSQTQAAMQKFQGDNGWQTKLIPDSRAIIKLGLGPAQDSPSGSGLEAMAPHETSSAAGFMQK